MVTVQQCRRCLYTARHPLGITFDAEGICSGCRVHEEKDALDWNERWERLERLVAPYRSKAARYDCIVPVTGANDSFFIVHNVVNRLKLKPLVVSYNKYFNTPVGIANLARLRRAFDVDFQLKNVDPRIVKKITRTSLYRFGNMYWPALAGQTVFPVQTAVMMGVPLIIWGAHQGLEQVGQFSHLHEVEMSRRYRKDHDLFGIEAGDIAGPFDALTEEDVINYRYPAFSDIEALGLRGVYLGNYVRWDPYAQHREMVDSFGYKGFALSRTFDAYDHADCFAYSNVHDLLKLFKHGYGKVTDQACREIRHGRLTRDQARRLVAHYEAQEPAYMDLFCDWLEVEEHAFKFALNRHRDEALWDEVAPDRWQRRSTPQVEAAAAAGLSYPNTAPPLARGDPAREYIVIGRGVEHPPAPSKEYLRNSWL